MTKKKSVGICCPCPGAYREKMIQVHNYEGDRFAEVGFVVVICDAFIQILWT